MSILESALKELVGREPTSDEVAKFYKLKEVLGLSDHDAMWSVLLAFGHYEILYGEMPQKLADLSMKLTAEHKLALTETANAAGALVQRSLAAEVERIAKSTTDAVLALTRPRVRAAVAASFGAAAIAALALLAAGYWIGHRVAVVDSAWLSSPEGRAARKLAELNNVRNMLECPPEWLQEGTDSRGTYCVPFDVKRGKAYGWRVK